MSTIKLIPPRKGKSPNYTMRGTYLKVYVDRSCGTPRKALAGAILRQLKGKIERGEYPEKAPEQKPESETFLQAAVDYMKAGGERANMARVISHFGETALSDINQSAIDAGALLVLPNVTPATRNRKFYTPVSAVMRYKNPDFKLRRPSGSKGRIVTDYLNEADAFAIIRAADTFDAEFGLLLRFLLYTGVRLNEPLKLRWENVEIADNFARIRISKNSDPRPLRLRDDLRDALLAHKGDKDVGPVFGLRPGGGLKDKLLRAKLMVDGLPMPIRKRGVRRLTPPHRLRWVGFHTFRHTWATWMRRIGGLDVHGLVATGNWRDARSAARYAHAVPRDEWSRVDKLPAVSGNVVERKRDAS
jgi:integrase